jgi:phosphoribosylaminoimidazole-succinocarboxamide synthase
MVTDAVMETNFPGLRLRNRGKVRDIYDLGDSLLIVATDRISAFDVVMADPIPDKGRVLTELSLFWFGLMADVVPNHFITADLREYPDRTEPYHDVLEGRSMVVRKAEVLPIECEARGYLAGSAWKEYRDSGTVHGEVMPEGLVESSPLPQPIFTVATKAESGHDINITLAQAADMVGREVVDEAGRLTLAIYQRGYDYARERGIIIADTKFEFGWYEGRLILVDEVLTPDSSRFWPAADYQPGRPQNSFDKQYLRDYLETLDWDKSPPPPPLPPEVIANTRGKYLEAKQRLVGERGSEQ